MTEKVIKNMMVFFIIILQLSCKDKNTPNLTIATASNMKIAMTALQAEYEKQTGTTLDLVVASSGKLTAQIISGAPFDMFVSADMKYPQTLYKNGFTISKPETYAYGTLILWTCKDHLPPKISSLSNSEFTHIAIANPKTAPYGKAAMEVLEYYHLKNKLQDKLVYGESISQTNQFIQTKNVDCGFTSKSVIYTPNLSIKGTWTAMDRASYSPIKQGVVILKNGKEKSAKDFYNFLISKQGQLILEKHGYLVKNQQVDE